MKDGKFFSDKEKEELEKQTNKVLKSLRENRGGIHIDGNAEINYLCNNCMMREIKNFNESINELKREYELLLNVKNEEINSLKEIINILKEELREHK